MPGMDSAPAIQPGADRSSWPLLLSPREIRGRRIRNRIVSTPHATGWGQGGLVGRPSRLPRAQGGRRMRTDHDVRLRLVDPGSAASYGSVSLWDPRNDHALRALADGVHAHGGVCISQMTHMGRRGNSLESGIPLRGVSDVPEGVHREVPVVLTTGEIGGLVGRFAEAASGCTTSAGMASR